MFAAVYLKYPACFSFSLHFIKFIYLITGDYKLGFRRHIVLGSVFDFSIRELFIKVPVHRGLVSYVKETQDKQVRPVTAPQIQGSASQPCVPLCWASVLSVISCDNHSIFILKSGGEKAKKLNQHPLHSLPRSPTLHLHLSLNGQS